MRAHRNALQILNQHQDLSFKPRTISLPSNSPDLYPPDPNPHNPNPPNPNPPNPKPGTLAFTRCSQSRNNKTVIEDANTITNG